MCIRDRVRPMLQGTCDEFRLRWQWVRERLQPRDLHEVSGRNERLSALKAEEQAEPFFCVHALLFAGEQTCARLVGIEAQRVEFEHRDIFLRIPLTADLKQCSTGLQNILVRLDSFLYRHQLIKDVHDFQPEEPFRIGNTPLRMAEVRGGCLAAMSGLSRNFDFLKERDCGIGG